ncbi:hypothetical protein BKA65DRAFT_607584 [Rhexocercosporidium sp. MPI-PUGE-AT-0058]|nr:hypothetical protein BKA65DRAFT_607584 [Rhexocercosporidium sp. MPI-PUGE-AT-0058]
MPAPVAPSDPAVLPCPNPTLPALYSVHSPVLTAHACTVPSLKDHKRLDKLIPRTFHFSSFHFFLLALLYPPLLSTIRHYHHHHHHHCCSQQNPQLKTTRIPMRSMPSSIPLSHFLNSSLAVQPLLTPARDGNSAALTTPSPPLSNDPYEVNEPLTPTPAQRQQQQQQHHRRPLRRTHIEAASAGISPPPRVRFAQNEPRSEALTHDFDEDLASSTPLASSQHYSPEAERRPHRALRISRTTASAILYTLEEALRQPNPFTSDLVEENASMSDLIGGGPGAAGNGRSGNGRAQPPPGTSGSPGLKGPREIMRERNAREARKRAENEQREALERARAAEETRLLEQERRRSAERRAAAAAGAAAQQRASGESGQRTSGGTAGQRVSDGSQQRRSDPPQEELQGLGRGGRAIGGGESAPTGRPRPTQQQQSQAPRPVPGTGTGTGTGAPRPRPAQTEPEGDPALASQPATRSSFPHAFERWETLSAHWEGLTSFWIRRLEENSNDLNRDPLSQQLSRQVTDLSAAGANLFHAVVELQRLRASSERKFQRWFFETRAEQERAQEMQAMLERTLEDERAERATAISEAVAKEREKANVTKQLAEMKRELQISKEEARRAWEELGRREQEERDRTAALKDGRPTLIGGVQVVPMMQGVPSRHTSARDPSRDNQYAAVDAPEPEGPIDDSDIAYQQYARSQRSEPADPFTETRTSSRPTYTEDSLPTHPAFTNSDHSAAPAVQPASPSAFYQQHQGTSLQPDPGYRQPSVPSEAGAMSEEEYEIDSQGQFIRDARGNKIRYQGPPSDADTDEYDVSSEREREQANLQRYGPVSGVEYGRGSTSTSGPGRTPTSNPTIGEPVDYSGQGYGAAAPEWAAVPRHHHPTRLSDVLEEDERSRTSASQISRRE